MVFRGNHKYGARKTVIDGIEFASGKEAKRYAELRLMEKAGEIRDLELQPRYVLQEAFTDAMGAKQRPITYRADFRYFDLRRGETVVEETKGFKTADYKLRKKLFLAKYMDVRFVES